MVPARAAAKDGWEIAVALVERWLRTGERVDALLEQLTPTVAGPERARAQHLFFGVVRWWSRLEAALAGLFQRAPRPRLRAVLLVMAFELSEAGASAAPVVHHAVQRSKKLTSEGEAKLVNAVGRQVAARLAETPASPAAALAHPGWLVDRWTRQFGAADAESLLRWNQTPADVHVRWRAGAEPPAFLGPTSWPGYHLVGPGHWEEVRQLAEAGALYVQDPSTRLGVEWLAPLPGENILDACAAPGGKSLLIADRLAPRGRLVALDVAGPRLERLRANLRHAPAGPSVVVLAGDVLAADADFFARAGAPASFDGVLLDAPCSNTGVMRHRVDVKWRLREADFTRHAAQQRALLGAVARLVRPGGRLVYSTCSLDAAENGDVVRAFVASMPGWSLVRGEVFVPWKTGHDGAGVFELRRAG